MKKINQILGSAVMCGTLFLADVCDDENSQECKETYTFHCEDFSGAKFEKCKARVIGLAKGGTLTTDGKAHLEEIFGGL